MAKLKRDERVCPFCAETIKASAIRCRYCQSDVVPVVEPAPEPESAPEPEAKPESESEPEPEPGPCPSRTRWSRSPQPHQPHQPRRPQPSRLTAPKRAVPTFQSAAFFVQQRLTLVLAALVVLAAAGVGVAWYKAEQGSSQVAPDGTLVGTDARTQVLVSAADLTQRTLSYNYQTLANDMEVARARMTPTFRKEYESTMAQVRANTTKNKIVLEAVVVSSSIIDSTEHKATVLVFVNQTTSAGDGKDKNQQLTRNSLVINLTRDEGEWFMSKLAALG